MIKNKIQEENINLDYLKSIVDHSLTQQEQYIKNCEKLNENQ